MNNQLLRPDLRRLAPALFAAGLLTCCFPPDAFGYWSNPSPITPGWTADTTHEEIDPYRQPLATDGAGNWVAVMRNAPQRQILVSRSTDNGTSWSAPAIVHTSETTASVHLAFPQVATDGQGVWVSVWADSGLSTGAHGSDNDIFFSRSTDAGTTWSPAVPLNNDATGEDGYSDTWPAVVSDRQGNWLAVWQRSWQTGTTSDSWIRSVWSSRSTDGGVTWSPGTPIRPEDLTTSTLAFFPALACDEEGNRIIAYRSQRRSSSGTSYSIECIHSADGGSSWSAPRGVNGIFPAFDAVPRVVFGSPGRALVSWFQGTGYPQKYHTYTARSSDGGATWEEPVEFLPPSSSSSGYAGANTFAADRNGFWIAMGLGLVATIEEYSFVWTTYCVSPDQGRSWSPFQLLDGVEPNRLFHPFPQLETTAEIIPALATDGKGRWVCLTQLSGSLHAGLSSPLVTGNDYDIFATFFDLPQRPGPVTSGFTDLVNRSGSTDTGDDVSPRLAADGHGSRLALWQSSDSLFGTKGTDNDILVARSTDSGQGWSSPTLVNGYGTSDSGEDTDPAIATDGSGTWMATWIAPGAVVGHTVEKVVTSRSTNFGHTWSPPAVVDPRPKSGPLATWESRPHIQSDGHGTWVASWVEHKLSTPGTYGSIQVARSRDNGATWSTPQAADTGNRATPKAITDGSGTWLVVFYNEHCDRSGCSPSGVRAIRSTNGGDSWTTGITVFTKGDEVARNTDAATDGHTWMVVWENRTYFGAPDQTGIRFARSANKGLTWEEPRYINRDLGSSPRLVSEGQGRWLCVWYSDPYLGFFPAERDILFSRSMDNGETWSAPLRVNRTSLYNSDPDVALDSQGRPVIAWSGKKSEEGGEDFDIWFATASSTSFTGAADWQLFE